MNPKINTPIKSIRNKCLECTQNQYGQIRNCKVFNCPIYPYRMGKRPDNDTLNRLRQYFEKSG